MKNNRLDETTIGSAKVIVDILPKGKVIPNVQIKPTSITVHNTGNVDASAKNNHNYMKNLNKSGERIASWHFTVGYDEIYQAQSCNYKCYHTGTSKGNNSSIGIEICMYSDKEKQAAAYHNAIELIKILMKHYGFTANNVTTHKYWSGKYCPQYLLSGKYSYTWAWFKSCLEEPKQIKVKVICSELNIRKGAGTNHPVVGTVKKNEVFTITESKDGWGKLKSGAGWISMNSKYVKKI